MALQKRSQTTAANVATLGTIAIPAGVQAGDILFMQVNALSVSTQQKYITDGWVEIVAARFAPTVTPLVGQQIFWRVATGSEPSTWTTGLDAGCTIGIFAVYSDVAAPIKLDAVATQLNASAPLVFPSLTFSAAGMRLDFGISGASFSITQPGGSTEQWDVSNSGFRSYLMTEPIGSSGATGTRTVTSTGTTLKCSSIALVESTYAQVAGPQVRSTKVLGSTSTSSSTDTIAAPVNMQVGDLLVAMISVTTGTLTPTISGWTAVPGVGITTTPGQHIFQKVAVSGDIGATITINWSAATSKTFSVIVAACFSPNGYPVVRHQVAVGTLATAATVIDFPTVTTTLANTLLLLYTTNTITTVERMPYSESLFHENAAGAGTPKAAFWDAIQAAIGTSTAYQGTQGGGSSNQRNTVIALAEVPIPDDPSSLTATASSDTAIAIGWSDNASNEANFELEHCTDGVSWVLLTSPAANATSYSHTGLTEHSIHYYRIRAVNAGGNSGYSNTGSTYTDIVAPSALMATAFSATQINLAWSDNSSAESGYKVEQSANGTTGWSVINTTAANAVSYSVTGLTANTIYYFRVRAYAGSEFSAYTSNANATTLPAAPSGLTAVAVAYNQIGLVWTDNSTGETGFKIERSLDGLTGWTQIDTAAANAFSYTDTTVSALTTYYYRVRSYTTSPAQNSAYSNIDSATTPDPFIAPEDLVADALGLRRIELTWSSPNPDQQTTQIQRSLNGVSGWVLIATVGAGVETYTDTGLTPNTTFYYRVRDVKVE